MANIKIVLGHPIFDGMPLSFKAPCNCTEATGINIEYIDGDSPKTAAFAFADAHGTVLTGIGNLFAEGAMVRVILAIDSNKAYIQNADTNAYLEERFNGKAPAGYPNACYNEKFANYGGADDGKFEYWAYLLVTEYPDGIVDVWMRGKFTAEPAETFCYGIDTTAVLDAINEITGKNYTVWETQRCLATEYIDAVTGSHIASLMGYLPIVMRRTGANKLYLNIGRVYTTSASAGPWDLKQVHDATSDGSAYMSLHLRATLS